MRDDFISPNVYWHPKITASFAGDDNFRRKNFDVSATQCRDADLTIHLERIN